MSPDTLYQQPRLPDMDLTQVCPAARARLLAWVEDRMINAVTPLHGRLQILEQRPSAEATAAALKAAQAAVDQVLARVDELRRLTSHTEAQRHGGVPGTSDLGPRTSDG